MLASGELVGRAILRPLFERNELLACLAAAVSRTRVSRYFSALLTKVCCAREKVLSDVVMKLFTVIRTRVVSP